MHTYARARGMHGAATAGQQGMANIGRPEVPESTIQNHHETRTSPRKFLKLKIPKEKLRKLIQGLKSGQRLSNLQQTSAYNRSQSAIGTPGPGAMARPITPGVRNQTTPAMILAQLLPETIPDNVGSISTVVNESPGTEEGSEITDSALSTQANANFPNDMRRGSGNSGQCDRLQDRSPEGLRLACHFYKRDPTRYSPRDNRKYRVCAGPGFLHLQHLKSHLENAHRIPQCENCYKCFNDHDDLNDHRRAESCAQNPDGLKEGIDDKQMEKIKELEPLSMKRGIRLLERQNLIAEEWSAIWDILFPGVDIPAHPFFDNAQLLTIPHSIYNNAAISIDNDIREIYSKPGRIERSVDSRQLALQAEQGQIGGLEATNPVEFRPKPDEKKRPSVYLDLNDDSDNDEDPWSGSSGFLGQPGTRGSGNEVNQNASTTVGPNNTYDRIDADVYDASMMIQADDMAFIDSEQSSVSKHEYPSIAQANEIAYTDSGYASALNPDYCSEVPVIVDKTEVSSLDATSTTGDDTQTIYSAATTVMADIVRQSISEVCKDIYDKLKLHVDDKNWKSLSNTIPGLIKALAVKLGLGASDKFNMGIMHFVHKNHQEITTQLSLMFHQPESHRYDQGGMSLYDKMNMWGRKSGYDEPKNNNLVLFEGIKDVEDEEEEEADDDDDVDIPELSAYSKAIINSRAYEWLISSLLKESSLHWDKAQPLIMMREIREKILKKLRTGTISKNRAPSTYKVAFHLPWAPLNLGLEEGDNNCPILPGEALSECIVLTCSSADQVQVTKVRQYLDQIWPSGGTELLWILQDALRGISHAIMLPDKTEIGTILEDSGMVIWVTGSPYSIAERGEQLAWLVAAFQHSDPDTVVHSTPIITAYETHINSDEHLSKVLQRASPCLNVRQRREYTQTSPAEGDRSADQPCQHRWSLGSDHKFLAMTPALSPLRRMQWHDRLYKSSSIIVRGFPTARRPDHCPGVEVPPKILFDLVQPQNLKTTDGRVLLQGRCITLGLARKTTGVLLWHVLLSAPVCSCRPHILEDEAWPLISVDELWHYRHILGDCDSTRASFENDGSPALPASEEETLQEHMDCSENSLVACDSPPDTSSSTSGSAMITDALAVSLDSELLSMSDTSEDMIIQPLDPEDTMFPIINNVVCRLLREYQRVGKVDAFEKSDSAADNELTNNNRSPGGGGGASHASSNSFCVPLAPNQGFQGSCRKRNRFAKDDDDAEGDESRRRQTKRPRPDDSGRSSKLLACPFWKLDPGKYSGCFRMTLKGISRVKQHLDRKHAPDFYCEFCLLVSLDEESHQSHVKSRSCSFQSCEFTGITHSQRHQLSRKSKPNLPESDQWFAIWDIVFPDQPRPTSAYMDPNLSEDLCQFREYAQRLGPARLAEVMQANAPVALEIMQEEIDSVLESVISQGLDMLFEEWLSSRASAPSIASSESSSLRDPGNPWAVQPTRQQTPASSFADSGVVLGSQVLSGHSGEETYLSRPQQEPIEDQLIQTQRNLTTMENTNSSSQNVDQNPGSPVGESLPQVIWSHGENVDEAFLFDNPIYHVDNPFQWPNSNFEDQSLD